MNITTLNTIGLDGVIIKKGGGTTTPPSGGGNGGGSIEYLDVTSVSDKQKQMLSSYAQAVKAESEDGIKGVGLNLLAMQISIGFSLQVKAVAIEDSATIKVLSQGQEISATLRDLLLSQGCDLTTLPRLTKEQFYDLNA